MPPTKQWGRHLHGDHWSGDQFSVVADRKVPTPDAQQVVEVELNDQTTLRVHLPHKSDVWTSDEEDVEYLGEHRLPMLGHHRGLVTVQAYRRLKEREMFSLRWIGSSAKSIFHHRYGSQPWYGDDKVWNISFISYWMLIRPGGTTSIKLASKTLWGLTLRYAIMLWYAFVKVLACAFLCLYVCVCVCVCDFYLIKYC